MRPLQYNSIPKPNVYVHLGQLGYEQIIKELNNNNFNIPITCKAGGIEAQMLLLLQVWNAALEQLIKARTRNKCTKNFIRSFFLTGENV
jgi:hypothetical protein